MTTTLFLAFEGEQGPTYAGTFAAAGRLVVGTLDNTVKVWETATGKEVHSLEGHKEEVLSVALSPDGNHIV